MISKLRVQEIVHSFRDTGTFSYSQLFDFYLEKEPGLNEGTFKWRIYHLKQSGIIRSVRRGVYILEARKNYTPANVMNLAKIYKVLNKQFPYTNIVLWESNWLSEFMIHQPIQSMTIVETDRDSTGAIFTSLKEKYRDVYLEPDRDELRKYVHSSDRSMIIKPLIVDAPIDKLDHVVIPKIEKILVDLFVETDLFISFQGEEKRNIFENIFERYSINMTTLYRYASKRKHKDKLISYMKNETEINKKYLEA